MVRLNLGYKARLCGHVLLCYLQNLSQDFSVGHVVDFVIREYEILVR